MGPYIGAAMTTGSISEDIVPRVSYVGEVPSWTRGGGARYALPMKRPLLAVVAILFVTTAYLLAWPIPVQPVVWSAPVAPGYAGPHAVNTRLSALAHLPLGGDVGPEHVVVREERGEPWIWMAVAAADQRSGRVVRMRPDGRDRQVVFASTGRPLGFDFDSAGALIVADPMFGAHGGLLRVTGRGADASTELLTDRVGDTPLRYVDAVVVATDGRIYLSDASQRFGAREFGGTFEASVLDIIEHQCSGRILQYDPATRATVVVLRDLCFPNGVALSHDQQTLFVAETGAYRIWRVRVDARELSAAHAAHTPDPRAAIVLDNLPGYPDNLMRGTNGRIWTGLTKPRSGFIDTNASRPWLRALAMRLPTFLWPLPPAYGHVFAFTEDGYVVEDLQDPSGAYPETTAVTEFGDRWFIQSLHATTLGVITQPATAR
jgi:sugar lactone lactonase YvrE